MNIGVGQVRLEDIVGGTLQAGTIPWTRIFHSLQRVYQDGLIVVDQTNVILVEVEIGTVRVGDWILAWGDANFDNGAVAGRMRLNVQKLTPQSTANTQFISGTSGATGGQTDTPAGTTVFPAIATVCEVVGAGELTLGLRAHSAPGNGSIVDQGSALVCAHLKGS
jgi:hypothetical protein